MSAEHPTVDELVAYHADRTGEGADRIADHLVGCPECAALVLDLAAFPDIEGGQAPDELEIRRAWRSLESATEGGAATRRPIVWQAIAAVLALALVGVSVGLLRSRATNRELAARPAEPLTAEAPLAAELAESRARQGELEAKVERLGAEIDALLEPQPDVPIVDLFPEGFLRSGEGGSEARVAGSVAGLVVILNLQEPDAHSSYVVEVVDPAERTLWRREGLRPNDFGGITLSLPSRRLAPGDYRFRVLSPPGPDHSVVSLFSVTLAR